MEEVFYMFWMLFAKCDPDVCINSIWTHILTAVDYIIIWAKNILHHKWFNSNHV